MELLKRIEQAVDTCLLPVKYVFLNSDAYTDLSTYLLKIGGGKVITGPIGYQFVSIPYAVQIMEAPYLEEEFALGL